MHSRFTADSIRSCRPHVAAAAVAVAAGLLCPDVSAQVVPPLDGQVLWLKADAGVTLEDTRVVGWADQSAQGNDAGPLSEGYFPGGEEAPELVADAVNGRPVVRFDGVDDVLEIPNAPSLQPMEGSWTVIVAARRVGRGLGDFPQVIGSRPWQTGLDKGWAVSLNATGLLTSHLADGATGHDVPAVLSTTALGDEFEIWQIDEDRAGGRTVFYKRADLDRDLATTMPVDVVDQFEPVHLGREMGGANNRRAHLDLAEVLVYNRLLSEAERVAVTGYLAGRYGLSYSLNVPPTVALTSPAAGAGVVAGATLLVEATASDPDGAVERVEFYDGEELLTAANHPPYRATLRALTPGSLSLKAVAIDDRNGRSESASVAVTVTGEAPAAPPDGGLELWLRADRGVEPGDLTLVWRDQSGRDNHAGQSEIEAWPEWIADAGNGRPAFRFDGQDDFLEIANAPSLQPGEDSWTVFFTAQRRPGSQGDFPQVIGSRPWQTGLDLGWAVSLSGAGLVTSHLADGGSGHDVPQTTSVGALSMDRQQVWQVEENRETGVVSFFRGGNLDRALAVAMPGGSIEQGESVYIGREIGGTNSRRASMDLAEILVYRGVLSAEARRTATGYLSGRAGLASVVVDNAAPTVTLTAPADGATIPVPATLTLTATADDVDGTVASVRFFRGGIEVGVREEAPYSISLEVATLGAAVFTAVATDNLGAVTTSAPVSVTFTGAPRGVAVGSSKLIGTLQYSDSFTIGEAAESPERQEYVAQTHPLPAGVDLVENTHGNGEQWWGSGPFSIATDASNFPTAAAPFPGSSGAGSDTGFTQRGGGGDWSLPYGLGADFVIQFDYVQQPDRVDVTIGSGDEGIGGAGNLSIFFRRTGHPTLPEIGIYNPQVGEIDTGLTSGIAAANEWNNYAIRVNMAAQTIEVFTKEESRGVIDLATLRDGAYAPYLDNAFVGIGGAGNDRQWSDNFQVGLPGSAPPAAPFFVTNFVRASDGSSATLTWASQPGRTYAVDVSTALTPGGQPGGWQTLAGVVASQGAETRFVDTAAGSRADAYYRVRDVTP